MGKKRHVWSPCVIVILLAGCSEESPTDPRILPVGGSEPALTTAGAGFPIYGLGAFEAAPAGEPCAAPENDQFDFWVGEWNVFDPEGEQIGTNSVTIDLNGCVVAEHWTDSEGGRGRSINTFDPETGQWHQTWVAAAFSGHLRMAGGLDDRGRMVLSGQREAVRRGFTLFDEYTWTALGPNRVEQIGILRVPAVGFEGRFVGIYERTADLTPAAESPTTGCQPGGPAAQARELHFWIGDWTVSSAQGQVLGTSKVSTDLSGCLIEERFRTPKGYEAVTFAYFDVWEQRWFRTYIDNRGERVELAGETNGGPLVLTGPESGPGASPSVLLRLRLETHGGDSLRQRLEVSRDEGASWQTAAELVYTPREPAAS